MVERKYAEEANLKVPVVCYTFGYCQFAGQNMFSCEILGFHGSDYEKCSLVGCVAL